MHIAGLDTAIEKHPQMSRTGGSRDKKKEWAKQWASQHSDAANGWAALPSECPDEPNCGEFCVWRGPREDGYSVDDEHGPDMAQALHHTSGKYLRGLKKHSFSRYFSKRAASKR